MSEPINRINEGLSIIMSAYQTQDFIEEALDSILKQEGIRFDLLEVLIGIDGCERTLNKVMSIIDKYKRLSPKVIFFKENKGTYVVSNTLVTLSKYKNLLRFDSDDIMKDFMIRTIMNQESKYNVIRFKFENFYQNLPTKTILYKTCAEGCFFCTKQLFMLVGGFVPWICSGDSEFRIRIKPITCENIILNSLFLRRKHPNSLTENSTTGIKTDFRKQTAEHLHDNYNEGIIRIELIINNNYEIMFDLKDYWEKRYATGGNSGAGSYNEEAKVKAQFINEIIKKYKIDSIMEYGCGDGNNLMLYSKVRFYTGYDISPTSIELCRMNPNIRQTNHYFTSDLNKCDYNADMGMLLDILFHQVEDSDYNELLDLTFKIANHSFVLVYATNRDNNENSAPHVRHRKVKDDIAERYKEYELIYEDKCSISDEKLFLVYKK